MKTRFGLRLTLAFLVLALMILPSSDKPVCAAGEEQNSWDEVLPTDFDGRDWVPGWQNKNADCYTLELVPQGQTVENWQEIVTLQFFPELQSNATPHQMMDVFLSRMQKYGAVSKVISETKDGIIFEWEIKQPPQLAQYELDKIAVGQKGLHFLHYATKNPNQKHEIWLKNFQNAKIMRKPEGSL